MVWPGTAEELCQLYTGVVDSPHGLQRAAVSAPGGVSHVCHGADYRVYDLRRFMEAERGVELSFVPADAQGRVDYEDFERLMCPNGWGTPPAAVCHRSGCRNRLPSMGQSPPPDLNIRDYDSAAISDELSETYGIATRPGAHCATFQTSEKHIVSSITAIRQNFKW